MIISKTPFRISFFGGSTDYPQWYLKNKGMVISASINKYSYIVLKELAPIFKYKYRLRYFHREETKNIESIKHNSVRECLKFMKVKKRLDIVHFSDLPAATGIGSSSAFTVGLLNALYKLKGKSVSKKRLYKEAIYIEQKMIKENVGSQDQVATSVGGLNIINFRKKKIIVKKLFNYKLTNQINRNSVLIYSGIQRSSNNITSDIIKNMHKNKNYIEKIYKNCERGKKEMSKKKIKINIIGKLMHEQWNLKKKLSRKISNNTINKIYNKAIKYGAYGGKILGAGGGGFVFMICPKSKITSIKKHFKDQIIDFKFENKGTGIIGHLN
jgi:D-glycero-alpha-D-manno-heptose-7-phosphate kinase